MKRRNFAAALPLLPAWGAVRATVLAAPTGPVMLSIGGRIGTRNVGDAAAFDMAMLAALPQVDIATRTPWYAEPRTFTGPLLRDLLARAGVATGPSTLRAVALNDYRVDIPIDDARRHDPIVARLLDGKPMSVREKGPLFVMYPFDAKPDLKTAVYFSRCIWQLRSLEVR